MTEENRANRPVPQELSQPEAMLFELNKRIWATRNYLMGTFFRDDTWDVRQGVAHRFPIFEANGESNVHDWDKEEQLIKNIVEELGDRFVYYEAAYYFPDVLAALGMTSSSDWVETMAKRARGPKAKVAEKIIARNQRELTEESRKFKEFLDSDAFRLASTITVDRKTGEYQITDLQLDSDELRAKWQELLVGNSNGAK